MNNQSGLAIVAAFLFPYEAELAKALLSSHDIAAWVLDENQIRQRWHLAGALGGVKVAVVGEDLEAARQILSEDNSAALALIPEAALPPHPNELCPQCGRPSGRIAESATRLSGLTLLSVATSYLFGGVIPLRTVDETWVCDSCCSRWSRRRPPQAAA